LRREKGTRRKPGRRMEREDSDGARMALEKGGWEREGQLRRGTGEKEGYRR
jgi:hypothetical protein